VLCFFAGDAPDEFNHQPHNAAGAQQNVRLVAQSKSVDCGVPTLITMPQLRFEHCIFMRLVRWVLVIKHLLKSHVCPGLSAYRESACA
jgi:hypothetical protein